MLTEQYTQILKDIAAKPTMEKLIEYLKELNFEFMDMELAQKLEPEIKCEKAWMLRYSYLVRRYEKQRFDFDLMIGVRFMGIRMPKYLVFINKDYAETFDKPWHKPQEFNQRKKKVLLKFPDELDIEERKEWRKYHDWWKKGRKMNDEQMAWYMKFKPMIKNLDKEFDHLN